MNKIISQNLLKRKSVLENAIRRKEQALSNAPEGRMRFNRSNKKPQFYRITTPKDPTGKYISQKDADLIKALAQKDYDEKFVRTARKELAQIIKLLAVYEQGTVEDIYPKLALPRQQLVTPVRIPDEEYVRQWLDRKYEPMGFGDNDPVIKSLNDLRVRSKSERLWADTLDKYDVPFLYEPPLYLEGYGWVRPDFCALNVSRRKELYIENLGMMDDPEYAEDNVRKIRAYEDNGLFIGDKLLITMETQRNPVNPQTIEALIKKYLL